MASATGALREGVRAVISAVAIAGHVDRTGMVMSLVDKVDPQYLHMDDGTKGCFLNHLRAWETLSMSGAYWGVVLEDDAVPVQCFRDQLNAVLAVAPSPVVSLYLGRTRPRFIQPSIRAFADSGVETCWLTTDHMLHAVGYAVHRNYIASMLRHLRRPPAALLSIDRAIGHWTREGIGGTVSYTWPSLVDHADTGSVIEVHPDGEPRGPVLYLDEGQPWPTIEPRVAWRVGQRAQWDSTTHVLG